MIKQDIVKKHLNVLIILIIFSALGKMTGQSIQDTVLLNEVQIESTIKTQVSRNHIPITTSLVTRREIDESGESALLPVLTGRVPGLFVTERGITGFGVSAGSAGTVNIRGVGGGNKVLILFDGQPQWAGIFGHHLPDTYVSSDAEKVEVIRGPASLLYGSNAMGGAINIITRKPSSEEGTKGQFRLQYGSYNTQKYMGNVGVRKGKLSVFASLNHDRTDGHRDNSKFYITNGFLKLAYDISPRWKATANVLLSQFKTRNPGTVDEPKIDNWVKALRSTYSLSIDNHYAIAGGSVRAFYNYGDHEVNDGWKNGKPRDYIFNSHDHNAGLMAYESFRLFEGSIITVGFDFKNWGGKAWNKYESSRKEIIDTTITETAFYLVAQQTISRFTLNAGMRVEMNEEYHNEWVPQLGLAYQASKSTTLKTSLSKGFRSPNIRDLYMYAAANPHLKPESMMNYDFSVLQRLNNKLDIELTGYYIKAKNMIQINPDISNKNTNSGAFINKGIEAVVNYSASSNFNLTGTYSFLHTSKNILAAPKHLGFIEARWHMKKIIWSANGQYVGGLILNEKTGRRENYFLLNTRIAYKPAKSLLLFANAENLTATHYAINEGFPMPKTTILAGIEFRF